VLGHASGSSGAPTVLLYGHYDVQPSAPDDLWTSPPFEPTIRTTGGLQTVYARGASDSKGQFWPMLEAIRAWRNVSLPLPVNIVVVLEGEEEMGSPSLPAFIDAYRDQLGCDVAIVSDSDMWSPTRPAITTRMKGLVHEKVTILAPNGDLHSGHFGTVAANPIQILASILARIHAADGSVTIPGFYEGVHELPEALREQWNALDHGEALGNVSIDGGPREGGHTPTELMWGRPGVDINGIFGGNTGPSERSVLPGSATARLSFRLVGGQDPETIRGQFRDWVRRQMPEGCRAEFDGDYGTPAVSIREASLFIDATRRALDAEWPEPTLLKGTGGTVPLVGLLADKLAVDCIVMGFILADDAIHAADEHIDVERLRRATRSWVRIFDEIGRAALPQPPVAAS
jgi:acetylornithine deacetylase/succinyl-diaminopimelate desuccinylase-like protein